MLRSATAEDAWVSRMCGPVAGALLDLGVPGLTIHVRDAPVRDALITLSTLDPPVQGIVSLWTDQHYGDQVRAALDVLRPHAQSIAAYLVTESVPMRAPDDLPGERTAGLANIALLRRPADMDEATWLPRWLGEHTPVAMATQSTFGYG